MANRGIRRQSGETVGTAPLQTDAEFVTVRGRALRLVCLGQSRKRPLNCFLEHGELGTALLLLQHYQRLAEIGIA